MGAAGNVDTDELNWLPWLPEPAEPMNLMRPLPLILAPPVMAPPRSLFDVID